MKTITLDDEAYTRLKLWKSSARESFSMVIKRVVPIPGTLGAMLNFVETADTARLPGNDLMEDAINCRSTAQHDPWS